jgi:hypothetical protein
MTSVGGLAVLTSVLEGDCRQLEVLNEKLLEFYGNALCEKFVAEANEDFVRIGVGESFWCSYCSNFNNKTRASLQIHCQDADGTLHMIRFQDYCEKSRPTTARSGKPWTTVGELDATFEHVRQHLIELISKLEWAKT